MRMEAVINKTLALLALMLASDAGAATMPPSSTLASSSQTIQGSPIVVAPVERPTAPSCTIIITNNFLFDSNGKISDQNYDPPTNCPAPWSKIILDVDGTVDGEQYSRYGFIYLEQAELLRFTTPEPQHHAISWHVEKDVTAYSSMFASVNERQHFLVQLDNPLSPKHEGVYHISAKLTFYTADKQNPAIPQPNVIKTISSGEHNQPYFTLTSHATAEASSALTLPTTITHAYLEINATPKGDEEFWYLPGGKVAAFREIQVYIDEKLVGIAWPFPYIYSSQFNSHMWSPLTAIRVLNIPPYVIDITPFAGWLNKPFDPNHSNVHHISIKLNVPQDAWIVDANLLLNTEASNQAVSGELTQYELNPQPTVTESPHKPYKNMKFTRSLAMSGYVKTAKGVITTTVKQNFSLTNSFPEQSTIADSPSLQDHLMRQVVNSNTAVKTDSDNQVTSTQQAYTFRTAPTVYNNNSALPKPFKITQTLQNTVLLRENDSLVQASHFIEEVNSAIQLRGEQNYFTSNAASLYRDLSGKCLYHYQESAQNQLTLQTFHNQNTADKNWDLKSGFDEKCSG